MRPHQKHFVATLESLEEETRVSQESIVASIVATVVSGALLVAALAVFHFAMKMTEKLFNWVGKKVSDRIALSKELKKQAGELKTVLSKTYLNPEWLDKQQFVQGPISGQGIVDRLVQGNKLPKDVPDAVRGHLNAVINFLQALHAPMRQYATKINAVWDKMTTFENINAAIEYGEKELQGIRTPAQFLNFKSNGLLGNPKLVREHGDLTLVFEGAKSEIALPALTRDQVQKVAQVLLELTDSSVKFNELLSFKPAAYDYEDDQFSGENEDLWQQMIGQDIADHYSHNHHESEWLGVLWESVDSVGDLAKALELWLSRSIK